jgi:hypothetical protein
MFSRTAIRNISTSSRQPGTDHEPSVESMFSPTRLFAPIMAAVVTWVIGLYVALVLESPYWNDDILNKNLPSTLKASHMSLAGFIWAQISAFVRIDARFFPGGLAWTYSLFDVFDNRTAYKLVVGLMLALALSVAGLCVASIAKSWVPAGAFVLIASGTLQVRLWADGITSFAGLMTLTTALTLGALLLLLVKSGRWWTVLAGALYLAALLTYEAVFALAPVMIAIIVLSGRDWRPTIAIAVPATLAFLTAISLKLLTNAHPISEYTLSFLPGAIISTFAKQMVAALPLSQWWLGHTVGLPPIAGTLILLSAVLIGVPVFIGLRHLAQHLPPSDARTAALLGLLGAWMWIAPAVLIAVTKRWQTGIPLGQGYISVVYEYFGLALCLLSLWLFIGGRLRAGQGRRAVQAWNVGGPAAFAVLSTLTLAANLSLMP